MPESEVAIRDAWEALKRIDELLLARERLVSTISSRLLPPGFLLVVAAGASILLNTRLKHVAIEVDVHLDSVSFGVQEDAIIPETIETHFGAFEGDFSLSGEKLRCTRAEVRSPTAALVYLDACSIPKGSVVSLENEHERLAFALTNAVLASESKMTVTMLKGAELCGCGSSLGDDGACRPVTSDSSFSLRQRDGQLAAHFEIARKSRLFEVPIQVTSFIPQRVPPQRELPAKRQSGIKSGVVFYDALQGLRHDIREGQVLTLSLRRGMVGVIESLTLEEGGLHARFRGEVNDIHLVSGQREQSLMPTHLDALSKNHNWTLIYSSVAWAFAMLVAVKRWWRGSA